MVVKKHTIYLYIYSSVEPTNKNMYNTIIHRTYNTLERRTIKQWYYKIYKYMFIIPYKYKCHLTARGCATDLENIINSFVRGWNRTTNMEHNADIQDVTYKIPFTLLCNSYLGIVVMYCEQGRGGGPTQAYPYLFPSTQKVNVTFSISTQ